MDLDELRLFQHLTRTLHYGETSRDCHVSPPTLTRTIQRLEEELDASLFTRSKRRVELTEAGEIVARYAIEALTRFDQLRGELGTTGRELEGRLRVFTTVTASDTLLPGVLGSFRREHPRVRIELETGYPADALKQLVRGRIDVAVASVPERLPRPIVGKTMMRTPLLFVAPRLPGELTDRLATAGRRIPWSELPMILPHGGATREHAERWFRQERVRPTLYSEVSGSEAILSLVALGCGVGVVPKLVCDQSRLRRRVQVLAPRRALPDLRVAVCTARPRLESPVVRSFWSAMEDATN